LPSRSCRLCSQIGVPTDRPLIASAQVIQEPGVTLPDVEEDIAEAIEAELDGIYTFTQRLSRGELPVW
jgi:S-adenosylmethionine synthetase